MHNLPSFDGSGQLTTSADAVYIKAVVSNLKTGLGSYVLLTLFNRIVNKFFNFAAFNTDDMVMVMALIQFKH